MIFFLAIATLLNFALARPMAQLQLQSGCDATAGNFCNSTSGNVEPCPAGKFSPSAAATSCTTCISVSQISFCPTSGMSSTLSCPYRSYTVPDGTTCLCYFKGASYDASSNTCLYKAGYSSFADSQKVTATLGIVFAALAFLS